ncbi:MAG TPA: hypothetical protein DDX39_11395 [Bacteroidales bacterium]|nr:MAG: hypothetical protein A2W98_13990 [Bacteroidetes bacterium GWF2_33_38]OFY86231.1 MAG: hypothetical protein A2236_13965 [Bacteroidetes bacterium RIFOXYA2_FULL_33_7]HBF89235.1 hypothetical protein [Bacteroidales bacterium]
MNSNNKSFKENLDKLIDLFKKLRDKAKGDEYSGIDNGMIKNLDALVENYDMIKDTFPEEMINQVGLPIKEMIEHAIEQLKEELGEIDESNEQAQIVVNEISEIDQMLKQPNLSSYEIDELLDKRAKMKNNNS